MYVLPNQIGAFQGVIEKNVLYPNFIFATWLTVNILRKGHKTFKGNITSLYISTIAVFSKITFQESILTNN